MEESERIVHSNNIYRSSAGEATLRAWCEERIASFDCSHRRSSIQTTLGRTEVLEAGAGDRTVVLLPGTNFATATWLDLVEDLGIRYRVIALDIPGQPGLSSSNRPSGPDAYPRWLVETLRVLRVESPILVGHSLGARVALAAAGDSPEIGGLALISPAGIIRLRVSPAILVRAMVWLARRDESSSAALVRMMTTQEAPPELVEWMTLVGQIVRTSFAPSPLPDSVLARVDVPCVILVGSHDVFLPSLRVAARVAEWLPVAVLEVVPGAGHLLPHERPDALEAALRRVFG